MDEEKQNSFRPQIEEEYKDKLPTELIEEIWDRIKIEMALSKPIFTPEDVERFERQKNRVKGLGTFIACLSTNNLVHQKIVIRAYFISELN